MIIFDIFFKESLKKNTFLSCKKDRVIELIYLLDESLGITCVDKVKFVCCKKALHQGAHSGLYCPVLRICLSDNTFM